MYWFLDSCNSWSFSWSLIAEALLSPERLLLALLELFNLLFLRPTAGLRLAPEILLAARRLVAAETPDLAVVAGPARKVLAGLALALGTDWVDLAPVLARIAAASYSPPL